MQYRRAADQSFFGEISSRRGQRPVLSDIDRKQGEHLGDIDALIELVRCNLALIPVDQPYLGRFIHNQGRRGDVAVTDRMGVREDQLLPGLVKDLIGECICLGKILQRGGWWKHTHDGHDGVARLRKPHGFGQMDARALCGNGGQHGTLGSSLHRGGDPTGKAAKTDVIPHFQKCPGHSAPRVEHGDLVGHTIDIPHLVVAIAVNGGTTRNRVFSRIGCVGFRVEMAMFCFGDQPCFQVDPRRKKICANDALGRDPNREKCAYDLPARSATVLESQDKARGRSESASQEHGEYRRGKRELAAQNPNDDDDGERPVRPANRAHGLGFACRSEECNERDGDQVDCNVRGRLPVF